MEARNPENVADLVKQLREKISDVIPANERFNEKFYLLQWLKRHTFKMDQTEKNIRESIKWRKENNIECLGHADPLVTFPGMAHEYPIKMDGKGKEGQIVITFNGNNLSCNGMIKKYGKEMGLRYIYHMLAKAEVMLIQQILDAKIRIAREQRLVKDPKKKESENEINDEDLDLEQVDYEMMENVPLGFVIALSFKDVSMIQSMSKDVIAGFFEVTHVGANYYPVICIAGYAVNMNKFAYFVLKALQPIISCPYYAIKCYGTDQEKWVEALSHIMDGDKWIEALAISKTRA